MKLKTINPKLCDEKEHKKLKKKSLHTFSHVLENAFKNKYQKLSNIK